MKKAYYLAISVFIGIGVLFTLLLLLSAATPAIAASPIYVRTDGHDTECNGTANAAYSASVAPNCAVKTIQKGIDLVDPGGTVLVITGAYPSSTINIGKSVTIQGQGSPVVIQAGTSGGYGLSVTAGGFTLKDVTVQATSGTNYAVKISGSNGVLVENVEITGSVRSGLDLIGCKNATLKNINSHHNGGTGIAVSNSTDVTLTNITTSNNVWGGIGLFTNATYYTGNLSDGKTGLENITLNGTNTLNELNPLYLDYADSSHVIRNFVQSDFEYVVRSTATSQYVYYQKTKASALDLINALPLAYKPIAAIQKLSDGSFHVLNTMNIQPAIDLLDAGGTVYVYPGDYIETAVGRYLFNDSGPHQFGLFIADDKDGISLIGVDDDGVPITNYEDVGAVITTTAKNNFGYSGIFVEGDNVTIQGLEIRDNIVNGSINNNKTIEVIGDNFTLRHCHISVGAGIQDGGSIYFGDWRFNTSTNTSHIQSYTVENNWLDHGTSVDLANGAGYSGDVDQRKIINNKFTNDGDEYWPFISFNGSGTGVSWFVYSVGGAVISGNDFTYNYNGDSYNGVGIAHIRARGTYDNTQFDWESYWEDNTFNKAVVFGPNPPSELGTYSYTSGSATFNDVRRIGVEIATEVKQADNGHKVLAKKGTYTHPVNINKSLVVESEDGSAETILIGGFDINANNVTIDGFQILTGTASVGVELHGIYVAAGVSDVVLKNNVLTGSWTGGASNFVGGRGILTGYNVSNLTVENNVIEKWVSGLYLNPTNGAITVQNNEIKNNWAGAGTDGQGNVLFKNNYFTGNIEGIGASSVGDSFKIEENAFIGNANAVNWYSGNSLSASRNWWNGNKGPTVSSNSKGNGQPISSNVDYRPWLCDGTDAQPTVIGFQPAANAATCTNLATRLVFAQYPSSAFENLPFAQQPIVRVEDDDGNLAITYDKLIFIGLENNPVGGMLLPGPFYKNAVNGVATFSGLYINKAGEGYTLKAFGLGSEGDFILTEGDSFNVLKQQADLSVTVADDPDPVNVDAALTYTVTVTNNGPHLAQDVSVSFQLPSGFVYQAASGTGWSCSQNVSVVTCTRSILSSGSSASITIQGSAPSQAGQITATATVSLAATMEDPNSTNDQATQTTMVVELPPTGPSNFIYLPLVFKSGTP